MRQTAADAASQLPKARGGLHRGHDHHGQRKVTASALANTADTDALVEPARIVNEEFEALTERNRIPALLRQFARNAAVDGDGCLYSYWDPEMETGQEAKGGICTEVIENTRVFFGNPNDRRSRTSHGS